jgi:hypothetical protein
MRQQRRSFARWSPSLICNPNSNRVAEIVGDDFRVFHFALSEVTMFIASDYVLFEAKTVDASICDLDSLDYLPLLLRLVK